MEFSPELKSYIDLVLQSYQQYTGEKLASNIDELYNADFICASHYFYEDDTRFIFANLKAQELWEMSWQEFTRLESRYSAAKEEQAAREELLTKVKEQGIINDYQGLRISKSGKEFRIEKACVWNVLDLSNKIIGQAVKFKDFS
ncbi:MAG: MEKHLA domain-containing protein [Candidatus Melainabacteria bacterium]|nr:MEKHLA domain-containing protein [Candidatus Melainabacteria bacterium]